VKVIVLVVIVTVVVVVSITIGVIYGMERGTPSDEQTTSTITNDTSGEERNNYSL
jgi:hypothetical protein